MSALPVKSIHSITDNAFNYLEEKAQGLRDPLKTGNAKLDKALLGGLEWYRILTLAALSGGGKSITLEKLKRELVRCNPNSKFDILSFDWEMPDVDQVNRNLSGMLQKDLKWLCSVESRRSKEDLEKIKDAIHKIRNNPIYIVDRAGTVQEVRSTIIDFIVTRKLAERDVGLLVTLDHTLLTKGKTSDNEKAVVDDLCKMFVELKQECIGLGVKISIIMLSQLNRDIESKERVTNPLLHYPSKNDIFAASSVYYCSDYVLISHKPSLINGIEQFYGPPRNPDYPQGLPVFNPKDPTVPMVYWHLIKNRFGENITIMMVDRFKFSDIEEYN